MILGAAWLCWWVVKLFVGMKATPPAVPTLNLTPGSAKLLAGYAMIEDGVRKELQNQIAAQNKDGS